MLITTILILTVIWLAWSNGGNDNFMGVATLYGSGTMSYRAALTWATITTAAGCLVSVALAGALVAAFSGRGIVPETLEGTAPLLIAVAAAAAGTKFLATLLGMPTSTTHALTGGLIGVGLVAGGGAGALSVLGLMFLLPLALSPVLAISLVGVLYPTLRHTRQRFGIDSESCICLTPQTSKRRNFKTSNYPIMAGAGRYSVPEDRFDLSTIQRSDDSSQTPANEQNADTESAGDPNRVKHLDVLTFRRLDVSTGTIATCTDRYTGSICGIGAQSAVNTVHIISGGAVCFARAVNDTPKIAALLLVAGSSVMHWHLGLLAAAMVIGGLVHSPAIARTMSKRITEMNTGQGTTANVITSTLVLCASVFALPVSTTHISCSTIFGIGMMRGRPRRGTITSIILTWIVTLPMGIAFGAGVYWLLSRSGAAFA